MTSEVQKALARFGKSVIKESRANLTSKGKNDSSNLHKSLSYDLKVSKNSFSLGLFMDSYGTFVDKGVKGAKESSRAPNSPYRFGTGSSKGNKSLSQIMTEYAKRKGFQWKDKKTGKFMSHKAMGYVMARSKYNKGMAPTMFFTKPFEAAFKRLPDTLVEKFGLEMETLMLKTLNK